MIRIKKNKTDEPIVKSNRTDDPSAPEIKDAKKSKKKRTIWNDLSALLIKIGAGAVLILLLMTYLFGISRLDGTSMQPAVNDGDLVVFYRLDKQYSTLDLAAVEYEDEVYVLRVVAKSGDTVDINENGFFVNGALQFENYTYGSQTMRYVAGPEFPLKLNEDELFLLADNREGATDSRLFGAVRKEDTLGKIMMIIRRRNF